MTRDQRVERLQAIGASSFREGDLAMARAILEAVESVTGVAPAVPVSVSPVTSQREYEREKKRRQRDKLRDSVPVNVPQCVPGHVPGDNAGDMSPLEGVGGGLVQGISPVSLENETVIPDQNSSLSDPVLTLSQPGRARARAPRKGSTLKPTGVPADGAELDAWVALHGFEQDRRDNAEDFASFVRHHRGKGNRWVNWPDARANWKAKPWNQPGAAQSSFRPKVSTLQGHGDMSDWLPYAATGTGGS